MEREAQEEYRKGDLDGREFHMGFDFLRRVDEKGRIGGKGFFSILNQFGIKRWRFEAVSLECYQNF